MIPPKVFEIEKQLLQKEIKLKKKEEDDLKKQKLARARGSLKVSEKERNAIERMKKSKIIEVKKYREGGGGADKAHQTGTHARTSSVAASNQKVSRKKA